MKIPYFDRDRGTRDGFAPEASQQSASAFTSITKQLVIHERGGAVNELVDTSGRLGHYLGHRVRSG